MIDYIKINDLNAGLQQGPPGSHLLRFEVKYLRMQKPGSKFLCITGIRYLYDHDRDTYNRLSDERLSTKWLHYSLDVQFREIAHSIRNEFYNPHHNTKRAIQKILNDPVLFDNYSLISQNKRIVAGI